MERRLATLTAFVIERASGAKPFSAIATLGSNVTSFTNTGLSAGKTYSYRVKAVKNSASSLYTYPIAVTTPRR